MNTIQIDINTQDDNWPDVRTLVRDAVHATLSNAMNDNDNADNEQEISIVLASDAFIQTLNHDYRDKDKPTNVLSFPQNEYGLLGDVILARETIQRESDEQDKSFNDHLTHLIVHGTLHLLGYDHENDEDAEIMESTEIKILSTLGIKNPYEDTVFKV